MDEREYEPLVVEQPSDRPRPIRKGFTVGQLIREAVMVSLAGLTGTFLLLGGSVRETSGSTRSTKLRWQKNQ